jgi:hypothetical protein
MECLGGVGEDVAQHGGVGWGAPGGGRSHHACCDGPDGPDGPDGRSKGRRRRAWDVWVALAKTLPSMGCLGEKGRTTRPSNAAPKAIICYHWPSASPTWPQRSAVILWLLGLSPCDSENPIHEQGAGPLRVSDVMRHVAGALAQRSGPQDDRGSVESYCAAGDLAASVMPAAGGVVWGGVLWGGGLGALLVLVGAVVPERATGGGQFE